MAEIYALTFKNTGEILTPDNFEKYWKNYGSGGSGLRGWRPPKKMYYTEGHAKSGFSHIPDQLKPHINITKFVPDGVVVDGDVLFKKQLEAKKEKEEKDKIRALERRKERAQEEFERAKQELKNFS